MTGSPKKYRRCLVLAGGGGRLGAHLGAYQAACEAGLAPDVVLGTCGGALIAALVHAVPDPAAQVEWLASAEMLAFWRAVRIHPAARSPVFGLIARILDPRVAPNIPDLDADAMFERDAPMPALQWRTTGDTPDALLLGARVLAQRAEVGRPRRDRALFEPVVIGPARAAMLLHGLPSAMHAGLHHASAIADTVVARTSDEMTLSDAVAISTTDLIYLPPVTLGNERWLGGAVDLMPVELAAALADDVWIDQKNPANMLTLGPAWRAVFGIDARARQREVDTMDVAVRLDCRGIARAVPSLLPRRVRWADGRIVAEPVPAESEASYRRIILAQVEEGRRRCRAALASLAPPARDHGAPSAGLSQPIAP